MYKIGTSIILVGGFVSGAKRLLVFNRELKFIGISWSVAWTIPRVGT